MSDKAKQAITDLWREHHESKRAIVSRVKRFTFNIQTDVQLGWYDNDSPKNVTAKNTADTPLAVDRVLVNIPWPGFLYVHALDIGREKLVLGGVDSGVDAVNLTALVDDLLRGESLPVRKGEACSLTGVYTGWCPPGYVCGCPFHIVTCLMGPKIDEAAL